MPDHKQYCIRAVSRHDLEALIELCAEHAAYEGARYEPEGKASALARVLFADPPRLQAWVVEQRGRLVGYATATQEFSTWDATPFFHMDCLYLREEARGTGLGRHLLKEIADLSRQLGCAIVQWQTPILLAPSYNWLFPRDAQRVDSKRAIKEREDREKKTKTLGSVSDSRGRWRYGANLATVGSSPELLMILA